MFVDTWAWLALGHQRDTHHDAVKDLFEAMSEQSIPKVTTDYVLDETISRIFQRETPARAVNFVTKVLSSVDEGHLSVVRVTGERFGRAWERRVQWLDKPGISFTDLTSMVVMEEFGLDVVVTDDDDFRKAGFEVRTAAG